ncbi:MAG: ABC transporter substrate-binding protein [Cardiobacteriaceae bacterium]|nr:ABC transporter substrate-binding protein [Cardiobacteriaceae bacterium]
MKIRQILFLIASFFIFSNALADDKNKKDLPLIAVSQIVEHPALNEIYRGFLEELANLGYKDGENIRLSYRVAQGDNGLNTQIAQQFAGQKPAVVVAITTPSAQAAIASAHGKFPILFTGISDPVGAGLVSNLEQPSGNVSGVMENLAFRENLDTIAELIPDVKAIGTVYNPSEDNSNSTNAELDKMCKERGWKFIAAPAKNTGEVLEAARSLIGKVDAILITLDNTAVAAFPSISNIATQNNIPVFTFDTFSAQYAAVAIGYDEAEVGRLTARQAAEVLQGKAVAEIPVAKVQTIRMVINEKLAAAQKLQIPENIRKKANEAIK